MSADPTPIPADTGRERLDAISRTIIGAAQTVANTLGYGFLEKVYENSLVLELRNRDLHVTQQEPVQVFYDGHVVGDYIPDLVVETAVIVEVKAVSALERSHRQQCINYLKATSHRVCLLLNFGGRRLEVKRLVWHF